MYPSSSTAVAESADSAYSDPAQAAAEAHIQSILAELEQLPPDVQVALYTRLLTGLATKLTSAVVAKAIAAAKTDAQSARPKPTGNKRQVAGGRKSPADDMPRADSLLRQLNDPADPLEAWQRFGANAVQVFDVLRQEPAGVLEAMLNHRNMPPGPKVRGKSREKLAEAIAVRLEQHMRGY